MRPQFRFLRILLKYGFPLTVVLLPATILFGEFSDWPPASAALSRYANDKALLVGFGYHGHYNSASGESTTVLERSFVLVPSLFHDPKLVTVRRINELEPSVEESVGGFFYLVAWYVLSIVGTWWFWFDRVAT